MKFSKHLLIPLMFISPISWANCEGACVSDAAKEEQLWLSAHSNNSPLKNAFSDGVYGTTEAAAPPSKCSKYLEQRFSSMPLKVTTVDQHSLCEIISEEAEWDLQLRIVEMQYPGLL